MDRREPIHGGYTAASLPLSSMNRSPRPITMTDFYYPGIFARNETLGFSP